MKDFLNKENFSDSSFSFNKSFNHEEERNGKKEISEKIAKILKNEAFCKKIGNSVEKIQDFLEGKCLEFQKMGFLGIYRKTEKVQLKLNKVKMIN